MTDHTNLIARLRIVAKYHRTDRQESDDAVIAQAADALQSAQAEIDTLKYEVDAVSAIKAERDQALARLAAIETQEPHCYIAPERDSTFHHEHSSLTAYRHQPGGWKPLYAAAGASPVQPDDCGNTPYDEGPFTIAQPSQALSLLAEMVAMMDSGDEHGSGSPWHIAASAALAASPVQPAQIPFAWAISACSRMWRGEFAEMDARAEAARCGGTCIAFPLYRAAPSTKEDV